MGCRLARAGGARDAAPPRSRPESALPAGRAVATAPPPVGLGVKVLSDDCLAAVLSFLIIKHVSNCVLSSRLWRAAGLMRIPGAREELRVPQDVGTVHQAVRLFIAHAHVKGWSKIRIGPGRFRLHYGDVSVEEQYLPSAVHYSDRNNNHSSSRSNCLHGNSRQAWPSARRNRHLRVCNANGLALSGTVDPCTERPLTELIGQLVLEHCNDVTMTGLRICATRSGLHAIASTVSIEACEVVQCGNSGILAAEGSRIDARQSVFSDNCQYGICVTDKGSWCRLLACDMSGNGLHGVYASSSAHADVCGGARVRHNREYGLCANYGGVILCKLQMMDAVGGVSSRATLQRKKHITRDECQPARSSRVFRTLTQESHNSRGIQLKHNMLGGQGCHAGGRVLEYDQSRMSTRPHAIRVMLKSTPSVDMRGFDGRWGTLYDTWREDGLFCVRVDESNYDSRPGEQLLVDHQNVVHKTVLYEPILVYDIKSARLRRFAFHI